MVALRVYGAVVALYSMRLVAYTAEKRLKLGYPDVHPLCQNGEWTGKDGIMTGQNDWGRVVQRD